MRAISEMYMRSGGTASPKYCDECPNLTSTGKHYDCKLYQEAGGTKHWQPSWVACKFFELEHLPGWRPEEPDQEIDGQLSLFD